MIKYIHIDYRTPKNKEEGKFYGVTESERNSAGIFINVNKNRTSQDLADTFFHEMAHVFFAFHGKKKQMSIRTEERLAQQLGRICAGLLK